ncbi:MAG: PaaI family thioesterase [Actinomycetota bacterium]
MEEHEALIDDIRERLQSSEFYRWAGVELIGAAPGRVEIALQAGPQHLNLQGLVHGGILATLADTAMGLAVRTVLQPGRRHVTVQLGVEFLSPGRPGRIVAHGRSVKVGSQLGFAEADVTDPGGRLLAKAHSTLSVTAEKPR